MKKIRIFDIMWDTTDSGSLDDYNAEEVDSAGLPPEYIAKVDDDFDPDEAADLLSDEFDFCVFSCSVETLQISPEQNNAEEQLCRWVKELALMGVSKQDIYRQVDWTLDELAEQLGN